MASESRGKPPWASKPLLRVEKVTAGFFENISQLPEGLRRCSEEAVVGLPRCQNSQGWSLAPVAFGGG